MITDILTVMWKEFKEIFLQRGSLRGGFFSVLLLLFVVGVFLPFQGGQAWVENPLFLITWSWLPLFLVMGVVADSVAGERERHTLETLLASRLSERAILFGKLGAAVLYAWGTTVAGMFLALVTVNGTAHGGGLLLYPLPIAVGGLLLSLLGSLLMACLGILVSLRAETVRQAYQRLSAGFLILWFVPMLGLQFMPADAKAGLISALSNVNATTGILVAGVALFLIDGILFVLVLARFNRQRLVLG